MPPETVLQCSRGPTKGNLAQRWDPTRFKLQCLPAIHYVLLKFARILDAAQRNPPQQSHLKPHLNAKHNLKINSSHSRQPGTARQRTPSRGLPSQALLLLPPSRHNLLSRYVCATGNACRAMLLSDLAFLQLHSHQRVAKVASYNARPFGIALRYSDRTDADCCYCCPVDLTDGNCGFSQLQSCIARFTSLRWIVLFSRFHVSLFHTARSSVVVVS